MDYNLDRYGFKKVAENWYFYDDNSGIMHICDPNPNKTGDYPSKCGTVTPGGKCSECGQAPCSELELLLNVQRGLGDYCAS